MAFGCRGFSSCCVLAMIYILEVLILTSAAGSNQSEATSLTMLDTPIIHRDTKGYRHLQHCQHCSEGKDINITVTYTDADGIVKIHTVNSRDLSASWVWGSSIDENHARTKGGLENEMSSQKIGSGLEDSDQPSTGTQQPAKPISQEKLERRQLRQIRKEERAKELIQLSRDAELQIEAAAIEHSKQLSTSNRERYSIWRREYQSPHSDSMLKLMKDQIIMAKVYASIARSKKITDLNEVLTKRIRESQRAIGEANSDSQLHQGALERVKAMGRALFMARNKVYDCPVMARKLRAMLQYTEENIDAQKKKSMFLMHLAAKTIPKPLHCLPLQLTTDYFLHDHINTGLLYKRELEDPSLYHYAIFSDNVLAASVAINSTVMHAKEPKEHVFHIVTDRLNFAAMKMWFIVHPIGATVHVENIDEFKWLNSSYCPILRQLETARMKEYYFKANHPSSVSSANENLKYKNPKYLSMLNHLRFYMPEMYPKLDKILFLDDDVVVQKDLTQLWSIDMKGMVNGAVETCKESFHRFDTYLNFSSPEISKNFDPHACGWAFGMNIFDLKEWKKRNITGIYHYWQELNGDRSLWKLGSLPPGLLAFYGLTYALERDWHVLGLGYDPSIIPSRIANAAVIHYNGNNKPWLDLAIPKFKLLWSKYLNFDSPYLRSCNFHQ